MPGSKDGNAHIESLGWTIGKDLGEGAFGLVKFVTRKDDGQTAACKIIAKPKDKKKMDAVHEENKIMVALDHPNIVKCFNASESPTHVFLFLELCSGGELFDKIVEMGSFTEAMAAEVSFKALGALNYMHSKGIVHRDLKPENMLLATKTSGTEIGEVKLTDFGLSKMMDAVSAVMKTPVGTPGYVAPEVLAQKAGGYDCKVDVWSMGVIIYILLCGFPPFYADNDAQLFAKIKAGDYKFIKPYWDPISEEAKGFIRKMLVVNPKNRASIDELLEMKWVEDAKNKATPKDTSSRNLIGDEYNLKETEAKLAQMRKVYNAALMMQAKGKFRRMIANRAANKKAASEQKAAAAKASEPTPTPAAEGGKDPNMVDVKIEEDTPEKGGCCVIS